MYLCYGIPGCEEGYSALLPALSLLKNAVLIIIGVQENSTGSCVRYNKNPFCVVPVGYAPGAGMYLGINLRIIDGGGNGSSLTAGVPHRCF